MSTNDEVFEEITFIYPGDGVDWDGAFADLDQGLAFEEIDGTGSGQSIQDLYDLDLVDAADDHQEEMIRQAAEIFRADLESCRKIWSAPDQVENVLVGNGTITVRGLLYPGSPDGYRSPYWSFYRMSDIGILESAGIREAWPS